MRSKVLLLSLLAAVAARHPEAPTHSKLRNLPPINAAEFTADYWYNEARAAIEKRSKRDPDQNVARNLIMFLGDGMSIPTLAAARALKGQKLDRTGEEEELFFESFPGLGLAKTYCVNQQIADSACTATAYLCGVKNNYGTTGVTAAVSRRNCEASLLETNRVESIAEWALAAGKDVGIVTTTRITHASPSGAYAKVANRNWENDAEILLDSQDPERCADIAQQLINSDPGKRFKVILGGGRREFLPNTTFDDEGGQGFRTDGQNLIEQWQQDKSDRDLSHDYVWNRDQLMNHFDSPPEYLLGLFENSHMQYHLEANATTEPTLEEMTEIAIKMLSRNEKGFFLFVEGGRIDHAHHDNYVHIALDETLQFEKAVEKAAGILPEDDTLIVVTADHAHVMAYNGYTARGSPIYGLSDEKDTDGMPYMTISYTNGPGARTQVNGIRDDIRQDGNFGENRWRAHVEFPLEDETHGGDDVAVFARGPHYRLFAGLYEQSQIPHVMAYVGCIGPGPHAPGCNAATTLHVTGLVLLLSVVKLILL
ncbi:membrane-bound alkaline phosphatase-like isoform X1 [Plodia interpunctella]|uniref:membrane-bound alkaline phosphatase-like isoform X1 n=1 Tax=Plodia interpunctella TaxID=58824 RepID=UPI002368186B|nr:membrane-bound alkaline phosphatase-like isoform X1 [Plodia interpunctella]